MGRTGGRPLAVVTGAEHPTGLGASRALHLAGARVLGVTSTPKAPSCRSRTWAGLRIARGGPERWFRAIETIGEELSEPTFLLPTQDAVVGGLSKRRDLLRDRFRFVLPDDRVVQTLLDKTRFHGWAAGHGLPLPLTQVVRTRAAFEAALAEMPYPLIVKPLVRTPEWNRLSPVHKAFRFENANDADRIPFDLFAAAPSFVISQWIPGPDSAVYYCLVYYDARGELRASYTGRKLLQYPRETGSTALCVGTRAEELQELTKFVFDQIGFKGLGSLEVKYGPDGTPFITEPTVGRPNLQSYSAVLAGCNLHALAMQDALGLKTTLCSRPIRHRWWVEESAIRELASSPGGGPPVPWRLIFTELLRVRRIGGAYWSFSDPRPALALFWETVVRMIKRIRRGGTRG